MAERRDDARGGVRAPMVLAAGMLVLGMAVGRWMGGGVGWVLGGAVLIFGVWVVAEVLRWEEVARGTLAAAVFLAGAGVWMVNQGQVEAGHVARFVVERREVAVTVRAVVVSLPEGAEVSHGMVRWVGRAEEILTEAGWRRAAGEVMVQSMAGEGTTGLRRGERVELYGWLSRPSGAMNPGAIDMREVLAGDRVFAQVRVPRAGGVVMLDEAGAAGMPWLMGARLYLRGKLLEPLVREDVGAAYTLSALVLGVRDPAIHEVTTAFMRAGVAHLLAISGSHIVIFAWVVWLVLRMAPMRPRWREVVVAAVVMGYVLATPCGPAVVRAAVVVVMVLLARVATRPREYLQILAAGAVVVVLMRPADLFDAGFQLSFVSTAGLILFSTRVHEFLFGKWLARETLFAELAGKTGARRKLWWYRLVCAAVVANVIGAGTAAPLVAYHFGQFNVWAVVAGMVMLPVVTVAMIAGGVQLMVGVVSSGAAELMGPVVAGIAKGMIGMVMFFARVPGATVALRSPPVWVVVVLYAALVFWLLRGRMGVSRAMAVNVMLGALVVGVGWYAWTQPVGKVEMSILRAGQGSCVLMRAPDGGMWAVNAGAPRGSMMERLVAPVMRVGGVAQLEGMIVAGLDGNHAGGAGEMVEMYRPGTVFVSAAEWGARGQSLAGASLGQAVETGRVGVRAVGVGRKIVLGRGAEVEVLWPPEKEGERLGRSDLILLVTYSGRRVLIVDPGAVRALAMAMLTRPEMQADVVVFTGAERGAADGELMRVIGPLGAVQVCWASRGPWAARESGAYQLNAADGAIRVEIDARGVLLVGR